MAVTVITISRTLGAGGEDLGEALADALGFHYVDSEIIDRAAALAGANPGEVAKAEERHGLLERIRGHLPGRDRPAGDRAKKPLSDVVPSSYEELIVDVIKETAALQYVVIVAHGASIPLAGTKGLLRVLVTAPAQVRAKRLAAGEGVGMDDAERMVEESDRARAAFLARFYGIDHELPTHYDLVINTDVISIEQAQRLVLEFAK